MNPLLINKILWVMQCFLALTFLVAGSAKLCQSPDKVARLVPTAFPLPFLRTLGTLEMLGALGLILPLVTGLLPLLTPITSFCMVIVLLSAVAVHSRSGQFSKLPMLFVLLVLAITVAVGRSFVTV